MNIPVYAYVTKAKPILIETEWKGFGIGHDYMAVSQGGHMEIERKFGFNSFKPLNGKVVAKFTLEKVEIFNNNFNGDEWVFDDRILSKSCLEDYELSEYLTGKGQDGNFKQGFAWHMDNLEILDKPLELGDFEKSMKQTITPYLSDKPFGPVISRLEPRTVEIRLPLTRAPQSWMWAWLNGKRVILMSIQSQWAEKIMNGKKTIEVRKTAPKEMK